MLKFTFFILLLIGFCFGQDEKPVAAILDFQITGETSIVKSEALTLTARFQSSLSKEDKFNLVSRNDMSKLVIDEKISNCTDAVECAVIIGRYLKAKIIIFGDIGKVGDRYSINVRKVDVETAEIKKAVEEDYKGSKEGLLDIMDDLAIEIAKEPTNFWYYVGGSVAVTGGVVAYILSQKNNEPPPKLPKPPLP